MNRIVIPFLAAILFLPNLADALQTTNNITQYGMTFFFDKKYAYGQFANGDYWVKGPVNITRMTPDYEYDYHRGSKSCSEWYLENCTEFSGHIPRCNNGKCEYVTAYNGWEVNPEYDTDEYGANGQQGFDARIYIFNESFVPQLPYTAKPNESIVKAISNLTGPCEAFSYTCLDRAAVLTVLGSIPPGNGTSVFRPPYVGREKPLYSINDLRTELLPRYPVIPEARSLAWVQERFKMLQMHHEPGNTGRSIAPIENFLDGGYNRYGPKIGVDNAEGALTLMLDYPLEDKMPALIAYVQTGIDWIYTAEEGKCWCEGGPGIQPGFKLPAAFAATVLDDPKLKDIVGNALFEERSYLKPHATIPGKGLFGSESYWSQFKYWDYIIKVDTGQDVSTSAYKDPYGYIDGELPVTDGYTSCCFPGPWKGSALAAHLMPAMIPVWNNSMFFDYVDRTVNVGRWTQPDPCAPHDGNISNYGKKFGPDGKGGCILDTNPKDGIGRYPLLHATQKDPSALYGTYTTPFINKMWKLNRGPSCYDGLCNGDETHQTCPYDCPLSYHRADTNQNGCIEISELTAFIDKWKINNQDVTIRELIEAIGLWKVECKMLILSASA